MARAIADAHRKYSRRINEREGWTGHLWANRFYSTPLDDRHLWCAARYVEMNPVRAGLVQHAEDYPWSSAATHVQGNQDPLLSGDRPFPGVVTNWAEWLALGVQELEVQAIRENTQSGRPSGSQSFIQELEARSGRSLRPQKRGPKPRPDPSCRNSVAVP
jgi:putative transposase